MNRKYPGYGAELSPTAIRAELDLSDWESDHEEPIYERRTAYIGSVFTVTPSGKFYQPFACSNVEGCPRCAGQGSIPEPRTGKRVRKRAMRRLKAFASNTIKRSGNGSGAVYSRHVSDYRMRAYTLTSLVCPLCHGQGSYEAYRDEVWGEYAEAVMGSIGAYAWWYDGDLFACDSRFNSDSALDKEEA